MEFLNELGQALIPVIVVFFSVVIPALAAAIVYYIKKWTGVQVDAKDAEAWLEIALNATLYAAEQSRQFRSCTGDPPTPTQKMKWAIDFANRQAGERGLKEKSAAFIRDLIESQLASRRNEDA